MLSPETISRLGIALGSGAEELITAFGVEIMISVSASQLAHLDTAPVTLVPAPGAGLIIDVQGIHLLLKTGATPFTAGVNGESAQGRFDFMFTQNGVRAVGAPAYVAAFIQAGFIDQTSPQSARLVPYTGSTLTGTPFCTSGVNESLILTCDDVAAPADGDGSLTILINYRIRKAIT